MISFVISCVTKVNPVNSILFNLLKNVFFLFYFSFLCYFASFIRKNIYSWCVLYDFCTQYTAHPTSNARTEVKVINETVY